MTSDIHIPPELVEKALRGFLMEKEDQNPGFIRQLLDDLEDDAACLRLAKQIDAENNGTISEEEFFALLRE